MINKRLLELALIIFVLSIIFVSCDINSTNNGSSEILATDGYGNIISDSTVVSPYIYTYVGNNITVSNVNVNLYHNKLSDSLLIINYSEEELNINSTINSPFIISPESIIIQGNSQVFITIALPYIDSSEVFQEELTIISSSEDSIIVNIYAKYSGGGGEIPLLYGFHPAYPNPASNVTILTFALAEHSYGDLTIRNTNGDVVKFMADEYFYKDYYHEIIWDLKDNNENRVDTGIYTAVFELDSQEFQSYIEVFE
jgi:hypothetical protein